MPLVPPISVAFDMTFANRNRGGTQVYARSLFNALREKDVISAYGLDDERVVAVPYGLDPRYLAASASTLDSAGGPLLFPGAPVGRKNLDVILRAMAGALASATLEISGAAAADFPHYERMISSLGLQPRVRWLGHVADMSEVIKRAAVVVYPSMYEGFGFPPLEAMALGTPVVASDRGSLPEVLGDAALLVDPEDDRAVARAIESVLTRPEVRDRLRRAGVARARTFTWERCADRTLDVYRDVLNEHKVAV